MEEKPSIIADYLTYEEGFLLGEELSRAEIPFYARTCGPASIPFGQGIYYRILVGPENAANANEIAETFLQERQQLKQIIRCPKCKSEAVFKPENLPFWQRLFYAGTEVMQCETCGKVFGW